MTRQLSDALRRALASTRKAVGRAGSLPDDDEEDDEAQELEEEEELERAADVRELQHADANQNDRRRGEADDRPEQEQG